MSSGYFGLVMLFLWCSLSLVVGIVYFYKTRKKRKEVEKAAAEKAAAEKAVADKAAADKAAADKAAAIEYEKPINQLRRQIDTVKVDIKNLTDTREATQNSYNDMIERKDYYINYYINHIDYVYTYADGEKEHNYAISDNLKYIQSLTKKIDTNQVLYDQLKAQEAAILAGY